MHTVPNIVLEEESWSNLRMCWDRYGTQIRYVLFDPGIHSDTRLSTTPEGSNLPTVANYLVSFGMNKTAHLVVQSETSICPAPSSTCSVVGNYWPRPPFCLMIIQTTGMPFVMTQPAQNPDIAHAGS
jgi:hypothetical protein